MALLPNTIIYGATGDNSSPTEKVDGGTVVGVTSASDTTTGPATQTFPLTQNAIDGETRRSIPIEATGVGSVYNATTAYSAGTFAYEQVQFMIRTVATQINGVSNTVLQVNGLPQNRPHTLVSNKAKGSLYASAVRSGYWRPTGIAGQRTSWSTAPATGNVAYVLPTNNGADAADQAQFVTYKSVPGELAYMYGAIDANQDDYKARTL